MFTAKIQAILKYLGVLIITVGMSACGSHSNDTDAHDKTSTVPERANNSSPQMKVVKSNDKKDQENQQMTLIGQILYQKIEGGFFGFVANNGDKYLPSGLQNEYRKNGLIVELKVELIPNVFTTTQFGESIKVLEIKVLDSSKVTDIQKNL